MASLIVRGASVYPVRTMHAVELWERIGIETYEAKKNRLFTGYGLRGLPYLNMKIFSHFDEFFVSGLKLEVNSTSNSSALR